MAYKNPLDQAQDLVSKNSNKYNLIPSSDVRRPSQGSMSQEVGSLYNYLSDFYGIDLEDLVYGDTGFEKTKYPNGHPDFAGDIVYSEKLWNEFEDWAKQNRGIDFDDRRWERYKLDPDYFESGRTPDYIKSVRDYGAKVEPDHPILKRGLPQAWW